MPFTNYYKKAKSNKSFLLFLAGQGISSIGDTFQLIASTMLLFNITGSGLSAGFGVICSPIPSILLSPFAGSLGDKFSEKWMLVILDLLRGLVVIMFIGNCSVWMIYALLMVLSSLNVLYSPPGKKLVVRLLGESKLVVGNSLLGGASGVAYLVGPVLAGIAVEIWGTDIAFIVNGISFVISAASIAFIRLPHYSKGVLGIKKSHVSGLLGDIKVGFKYCTSMPSIMQLIISTSILCLCSASMNIAFYPFAFDILNITVKGWGVMLSILYSSSLVSMLITLVFNKKINSKLLIFTYSPLLIVSVVWFLYGVANSLPVVMLLQAVEGGASSLCGILLGTQLQLITRKAFISRVAGINDTINNVGRLIGIGCTYIILKFFSCQHVFIINSLVLLVFTLYKLFSFTRSKGYCKAKFTSFM